MRLFAQNRTRTGGRNRSLERSFDGLGFALFRHDANHFFRCAERWDGQRQRIRRNAFQTREIPFTDLLALAGIEDPLARAGVPSIALSWADVVAARPELLILAPCGFTRERALEEAALVQTNIKEVGAVRVVVLDGSAYFNRPGPRLVDSLEQLVANR